ncbi:uncharacterized protein FSUBG_9273 [Fusarium subglutinans]|uniref:Uncharacterized protein n=1 Tax=Gibberella subglutinans TaxID=42677 RepID=A0A8H5UQ04_GIBSU|nr:uncharacterized protein FSUBG_9273 [Fusarium subglutinans]KAF5594887.1 hypothetical protein FSUBG_9273 [Fusarium subglutinans]
MSDPGSQIRIQDSKERLQQAYNYAVSAKESAESDFQQAQDAGIADGQDFRQWAPANAPAWSAALNTYQGAKAAYDAALQNGDNEAFQAWNQKYREAVLGDNPARPNYEALVEP